MRAVLVYSLVRVGLFAVFLAALLLLGLQWAIAAVAAAVIALCLSFIFFRGPRDKVALQLAERRAKTDAGAPAVAGRDEEAEDGFETRADAPPSERQVSEGQVSEGQAGSQS